MTGLDADLATLRERLSQGYNLESTEAALARVEAELSRLREQRDAYRNAESWMTACLNCSRLLDSCYSETIRAEAAEARCARLQQALAHALDCKGWGNGLVSERGGDPAICTKCEAEAREALAALKDSSL